MLVEIYVRGIQNDMINPYDNGGLEILVDSVTHKLLKIDKALRLFIPPKIRKMTPRSPKDIQIALYKFKKIIVTYL